MSFVGGPFTHDVFVSYAHGRDLEVSYSDPHRNHLYSWSLTFIDNLREEIGRLLSGSDRAPDVWMDPALKPIGSPLEGSLKKEIQSSALLVTLMSPYYLRSQWCQDEARIFSDFARDFRPVERQDRIFVVSVAPTERNAWSPALKDDDQNAFLGTKFYRDRGSESWAPLGWPDPSVVKDEDYWTAITSLAGEITSQLRRMKHAQENSAGAGHAAEVPVFVGRKLLLGYCSGTLTRERNQLRDALSSMEMQILPGASDDITDPKSLERSYDAYLEQADAVVLVANEYCGTWPKDEEAGFISLQVRKARERAKRCYMWLNIQKPDQIQTGSYGEYLKKLPGEIAKTGGGILTGDQDIKAFASFVRSKLAALDKSDSPRPAIICSNLSSRTSEYKQFHEWILDALGELNRYVVTVDAGFGQIRLSALAKQVNQSDIILVVCFDQEWDWAKDILLRLKQVSPLDSANKARLLVVGPHFDPAKGLFEFRNYHFDTFNGSSLDATSFKSTLKQKILQSLAKPNPSDGTTSSMTLPEANVFKTIPYQEDERPVFKGLGNVARHWQDRMAICLRAIASFVRPHAQLVPRTLRVIVIVALALLPLLLATLTQEKIGASSFALHDPDLGEARWLGLPNPIGATPRAHSGAITDLAVSPDGRYIASSSYDGFVKIWDALSGQLERVIRAETGTPLAIGLEPLGVEPHYVVILANKASMARAFEVRDLHSGQRLQEIEQQYSRGPVSPLIAALLASANGSVGKQVHFEGSEGLDDFIYCAVVNRKELRQNQEIRGYLRAYSNGPLMYSRLREGIPQSEIDLNRGLSIHKAPVTALATGSSGQTMVSVGSDGSIVLWDFKDGVPQPVRHLEVLAAPARAVLRGHSSFVTSVAFSPDGARVLTGSRDNTARLWDAATGKEFRVFQGHEDAVTSVAFSPDGARLLTGSDDNTARLWDAATGKEISAFKGHEDAVTSVAFSPDGARVLTGSHDNTARLWDAATGKEISAFKGHKDAVTSVAFSPDGARVLTGSRDNTARLWDAGTGRELAVLTGHTGAVTSGEFSPDGTHIITSSQDGTARLWELAGDLCVGCSTVAFSSDGSSIIIAGASRIARLLDVNSGKVRFELTHGAAIDQAFFSADGKLAITIGDDGAARVWSTEDGRLVRLVRGHGDLVTRAVMSDDGVLVTAALDGSVRVSRDHTAGWLGWLDAVDAGIHHLTAQTSAELAEAERKAAAPQEADRIKAEKAANVSTAK